MVIHRQCEVCGKQATVVSRAAIADRLTLKTYSCGHMSTEVGLVTSDYDVESSDHKRPYKFQLDGAQFIADSNAKCLLLDEMGLGKTIQVLIVLKNHPELLPFLVLCKSSLKMQWFKEIIRWCGIPFIPQILDTSRDYLLPGFKGYIASMDLLRRLKDAEGARKLATLGIKTIVIDEVQHIKNSSAKRTNEVRFLCKDVEHVVGLSGTPIKNHAGEYFPILNIVRPDIFPSERHFLWEWVQSYWDGYRMRIGGLRNPNRFKETTKDFIIRRSREEVLPDLPKVARDFRFHDLGSEVESAYNKVLDEFTSYYYSDGLGESNFVRESNILAYLSKMRHLTGIAKIDPCVEFTQDFLESTDRKLVIFVHHKDVGIAIHARLSDWCPKQDPPMPAPLAYTAELDGNARNEVVEKFWSDNHRVMVASTLAAGEGLNLHCASECVVLERQWNPSNEEQAECRFVRIGQSADKVKATYFVAVGTVDEFLTELVEQKREIVNKALNGEASCPWDQSAIIRELAQAIAESGRRKWQSQG